MQLFRISRRKYAADLTGEGARIYGGRWNKKGISVIYTSSHASLAALEVLAHASITNLPNDLELITYAISDDVESEVIHINSLPDNWNIFPSPQKLAEIGTEWAFSNRSLLLKVPSAIIPAEYNVLINPSHSDMRKVEIQEIQPFHFDSRLSK